MWTGTAVAAPSSAGLLSYDPARRSWAVLNGPAVNYTFISIASVWANGFVVTFGASDCPTASTELPTTLCTVAESFDVSTGTSKSMSSAGAPAVREVGALLWTGTHVLTWGGTSFDSSNATNIVFDDGALYDPVQDTWNAIPANAASSPRRNSSAVWTGSEMLIWGGEVGPKASVENASTPAFSTFQAATGGAAYNPAAACDAWARTITFFNKWLRAPRA